MHYCSLLSFNKDNNLYCQILYDFIHTIEIRFEQISSQKIETYL